MINLFKQPFYCHCLACASSSWPSDEEVGEDDSDDEGTVVIGRNDDPNMDFGQHQRIEFNCQDDHCPTCNARRRSKCSVLLEAAFECNLLHMITLLWLIGKMCLRYKMRKAQFHADLESLLDYVEDETLADADSDEMLVPLGYDFMGILAIVGWFVFLCEYICNYSRATRRIR